MKETHQTVIFTDNEGGIKNEQFVPTKYAAIIVDRKGFLAMENFAKKFSNEQALVAFCHAVLAAPSGSYRDRFAWEYEGQPRSVDVKK